MDEKNERAPEGTDENNVAGSRSFTDPGRKGKDSGMTAKPDVHAGGVDENAGGMGAGPDDDDRKP